MFELIFSDGTAAVLGIALGLWIATKTGLLYTNDASTNTRNDRNAGE